MTRTCPDPGVPDGAWSVLREEEGRPYADDEEPRLNNPAETHNEAWADKMQAKREARMPAALAARAGGEEGGQ